MTDRLVIFKQKAFSLKVCTLKINKLQLRFEA